MRANLQGLTLLATLAAAAAHCRGLDRSALIRLYEALDGPNWLNNRNWNVTTGTSAQNKGNDPCDPNKRWYGVGFIDPCERWLDDIVGDGPQTDYLTRVRGSGQGCFAGRITSLNLRRNNLRGNFTISEIGDLENLTYVDMSWNGLEGAIPTEIGRLNNVQVINLAHNNISGELPTELGSLNSAGPLASRGCGVDDPCPLGVQLKLTELSLQHNNIVGTIPSELGSLVHLKQLDLGYNNLTGTVPSEVCMRDRTHPSLSPLSHTCLFSLSSHRWASSRSCKSSICVRTCSRDRSPPACSPTSQR